MIYDKINELLVKIITDYELPLNGLYLLVNKGRDGNETSKSLIINEPPYPGPKDKMLQINRSAIILNLFSIKNEEIELVVKKDLFVQFTVPQIAILKEVKSDRLTQHIIFNMEDDNIIEYLEKLIVYALKNYEGSNSFGCCSKYLTCSQVKKCLHVNKLYATGCMYRKNIEKGKIFFG